MVGGGDYSTVESYSIETMLPDEPSTEVTEQISPTLSEGQYRVAVQSKRLSGAGGWQVSSTTYSDGFIIDTTSPVAMVDTLVSQQSTTSFTVSWSGSDPVSGEVNSGISTYDVQYRDGETGTWVTWYSDTTSNQAVFNGQWRHT